MKLNKNNSSIETTKAMFLFHLIRMVKNQTFKINPDPIIMNNLLKIFGLSGLTDYRFFTKENMKELSTVEKIKSMEKELSEYYLPMVCISLFTLNSFRNFN